ncbi:hypothetical protein M378DRAFT_530557 [Amanita muscaria Koide BX008]|uniref:Protein kinase domain-containing protein n=1 Tax=Amanita muscaria (strain Koide BX008) TaxID=946122 RepID=A0A0C2TF83_AMAMK|nr:hypothetical protein M378DRAFT_530557 [Amanita muscaria Koide BX008]
MMLQVMLKVAEAIQYLNSMGILLHNDFDLDDIYLDSECHVKIVPLTSGAPGPYEDEMPDEENVLLLGIAFYELYFDVDLCRDDIIECLERPSEPEISEELWQTKSWREWSLWK